MDGMMAALASFSLRALAAGWTEPDGKGGHIVRVTKVAVFVHDNFNFEGEDYLGFWSCEKKEAKMFSFDGDDVEVGNALFRAFRNSTGRGGDFLVLSLPHPVENFPGVKYVYTCAK
jgi:hypothetical protein